VEQPRQCQRPQGQVQRRATLQDQARADENALMSKMAAKTCAQIIAKQELAMRLTRVRYTFDRAILKVLFSAEDRLDIRELVKELGRELHARVAMKQIGVRDEAGMIGGMGSCGRALCCCSWLHHFDSINVKMAKTQGLSLNPAAIGGCCGRLKCCLSYEFQQYRELGRELPELGAPVQCPDGRGTLVEKNILSQRVRLRLGGGRVQEYGVADIKELSRNSGKNRKVDDEDPGAEWAEPESAGEAGARGVRPDNAG
jgi:cell fate regulator YaaT (PSP1 superfamily)